MDKMIIGIFLILSIAILTMLVIVFDLKDLGIDLENNKKNNE